MLYTSLYTSLKLFMRTVIMTPNFLFKVFENVFCGWKFHYSISVFLGDKPKNEMKSDISDESEITG